MRCKPPTIQTYLIIIHNTGIVLRLSMHNTGKLLIILVIIYYIIYYIIYIIITIVVALQILVLGTGSII